MGVVIQFRRKDQPSLDFEELALLERLRGSVQAMWRGGWAEPGETGGVALLRNQHCVGLWCFESGRFVYRPIETGVPKALAKTVDEAYDLTLSMLGKLVAD
jgi:hypothetical protein